MIKDKYFRALFVIAIVVILAIFASCNPYKKISVATKITPENKELLSQTCERYFPPGEPKFIKGETVTEIDTVLQVDTLTIIDTLNNTTTKYVTKTNTVTVERLRTDTLMILNKYEMSRLNTVISDQKELLIRSSEVRKNMLAQIRKDRFTKFSGWGLIVLILGIYAVIKFKF